MGAGDSLTNCCRKCKRVRKNYEIIGCFHRCSLEAPYLASEFNKPRNGRPHPPESRAHNLCDTIMHTGVAVLGAPSNSHRWKTKQGRASLSSNIIALDTTDRTDSVLHIPNYDLSRLQKGISNDVVKDLFHTQSKSNYF